MTLPNTQEKDLGLTLLLSSKGSLESRTHVSQLEQEQKENPTADAEFNCSKPLPSSFPKTIG